MKIKPALAGCMVCAGLYAQGISFVDPATNWNATIPEPPIPRVAAGQSWVNYFGNRVTRITDANTIDGISFKHFYSDRSPLNKDSSMLLFMGDGGALFVQKMRDGKPVGKPRGVVDEAHQPQGLGSYMWSPSDPEVLYLMMRATELFEVRPRNDKFKLIHDFAKDLEGVEKGYLSIVHLASDGKRLLLQHGPASKNVNAVVLYDLASKQVRVGKGRNIQIRHPEPLSATFRLAGTTSGDAEGTTYCLYESGTPVNPSSGKPLEAANTLVYRLDWDGAPMGEGWGIAGPYASYHSIAVPKGNVRVASGTEVNGYVGEVNWLYSLRLAKLDQRPDPNDGWRTPFVDLFYWPISWGAASGAHVSSAGGSWVLLSIYQEGNPNKRGFTPFGHELVMVSIKGRATYDPDTHRITSNGIFRRIGHHHSFAETYPGTLADYNSQPQAALSLDRKHVVFTSTLGKSGRHDIFVLDLPPELID